MSQWTGVALAAVNGLQTVVLALIAAYVRLHVNRNPRRHPRRAMQNEADNQ
jgi:hypothetical protein